MDAATRTVQRRQIMTELDMNEMDEYESTRHPCDDCEWECDHWDMMFCCAVCEHYGIQHCEDCDPWDI